MTSLRSRALPISPLPDHQITRLIEDVGTMTNQRFLTAAVLSVIGLLGSAPQANAAAIRDRAGLFSPEVRHSAEAKLDRLERSTHVPVVIETIDLIPGLDRKSTETERKEAIN